MVIPISIQFYHIVSEVDDFTPMASIAPETQTHIQLLWASLGIISLQFLPTETLWEYLRHASYLCSNLLVLASWHWSWEVTEPEWEWRNHLKPPEIVLSHLDSANFSPYTYQCLHQRKDSISAKIEGTLPIYYWKKRVDQRERHLWVKYFHQ